MIFIVLVAIIMSAFTKQAASTGTKQLRAGLVWYKGNDLRVRDHQPLTAAHERCTQVQHVFVFDPRHYRTTRRGQLKANLRRLKFQVECVNDLAKTLSERGSGLTVLVGEPETALPAFAKALNVTSDACRLFCFDEVCHEEVKVLTKAKAAMQEQCGVPMQLSWGGSTLFDPSELPFQINSLEFFTGFRKAVEQRHVWAKLKSPLPVPPTFAPPCGPAAAAESVRTVATPIDDVAALWATLRGTAAEPPADQNPADMDARAVLNFQGGETAAWARLQHYVGQGQIKGRLCTYKETRNGMVGADYSTKFSPFLSAGTISARSIYAEIKAFEARTGIANENTYWVVFELLWRDYMRFYAMKYGRQLFFLGGAQGEAARFKYPWRTTPELFEAWKEGKTGYPFIDANMRELKHSGWMSNRGRQVVASFLVRDMGLDWRLGAEHFEGNLLDHDPCSNWGNWQYGAGVGSDPREDRYFNIVKQAHSYDPDAAFIRLWVPEVAHLPSDVLMDTRLFTQQVRDRHKVPESVYPKPVCSLMASGYKNDPYSKSNSNNGGGGGKPSKMRKPNHGGVPGQNYDSRQQQINFPKASATPAAQGTTGYAVGTTGGGAGAGAGAGGGAGGGGAPRSNTPKGPPGKRMVPISSFFEPTNGGK